MADRRRACVGVCGCACVCTCPHVCPCVCSMHVHECVRVRVHMGVSVCSGVHANMYVLEGMVGAQRDVYQRPNDMCSKRWQGPQVRIVAKQSVIFKSPHTRTCHTDTPGLVFGDSQLHPHKLDGRQPCTSGTDQKRACGDTAGNYKNEPVDTHTDQVDSIGVSTGNSSVTYGIASCCP